MAFDTEHMGPVRYSRGVTAKPRYHARQVCFVLGLQCVLTVPEVDQAQARYVRTLDGPTARCLRNALCSWSCRRLAEVGPESPTKGRAQGIGAPASGAAGFPWLRRRRRTGFFLRHVPLPELCTLSTARGARTTWATSEIAQRTAFFRDGNVCHRRTSSPIAHRSGRRDPFINCWICAWTAWLNSTALLTLPMPMAPVPAIPVLVAPLWIATSLGEPLS